jgi:putative membrane protein
MADVDPRVRFAAERTLLAWIRTGLAMMGFGFIVARLGVMLRDEAGSGGGAFWVGTGLITLSACVQAAAAYQHHDVLRRLEHGQRDPKPRIALGPILAMVLTAAGVLLAGYLVFVSR